MFASTVFLSEEQQMEVGVRSPGSPRESKVKGDTLLSEGMSTAAAFRNQTDVVPCGRSNVSTQDKLVGRESGLADRSRSRPRKASVLWDMRGNANSRCGECAEGCASYPEKCG